MPQTQPAAAKAHVDRLEGAVQQMDRTQNNAIAGLTASMARLEAKCADHSVPVPAPVPQQQLQGAGLGVAGSVGSYGRQAQAGLEIPECPTCHRPFLTRAKLAFRTGSPGMGPGFIGFGFCALVVFILFLAGVFTAGGGEVVTDAPVAIPAPSSGTPAGVITDANGDAWYAVRRSWLDQNTKNWADVRAKAGALAAEGEGGVRDMTGRDSAEREQLDALAVSAAVGEGYAAQAAPQPGD